MKSPTLLQGSDLASPPRFLIPVGESVFIDKIVHEILRNLQPDGRDNILIGIESRMDTLNSLLSIEATQEVRMIGIFGMEGIGKTTIAETLFRKKRSVWESALARLSKISNGEVTDTLDMLQEMGLKIALIEAIVEPWQDAKLDFNTDALEGMKNLRLLDVYQNSTSCKID
ncbi:hypothetical protein L1987_46219 [Smallanthus sonchifolius]|uniref:Uncharacterized protein n=1 Tax=Smallanthus sonchifolius TaxID=185202 RepID=A0ACB9FZ53_9ASTR|nr:hypothetical protein L1987_46219 [Smallanthus sonchifolius]